MSMIKALLESESAVKDNVQINSAISELAAIQESSEIFNEEIVYTAESVPVFAMPLNGQKVYVVECDNLNKLMDSQNFDEIEALSAIKSVVAQDDPNVKFDQIALLIKDEDICKLEEACKKDKSKIGAKTEKVVEYTNLLKKIQSEGFTIVVDR